jgi:hypothetical protein
MNEQSYFTGGASDIMRQAEAQQQQKLLAQYQAQVQPQVQAPIQSQVQAPTQQYSLASQILSDSPAVSSSYAPATAQQKYGAFPELDPNGWGYSREDLAALDNTVNQHTNKALQSVANMYGDNMTADQLRALVKSRNASSDDLAKSLAEAYGIASGAATKQLAYDIENVYNANKSEGNPITRAEIAYALSNNLQADEPWNVANYAGADGKNDLDIDQSNYDKQVKKIAQMNKMYSANGSSVLDRVEASLNNIDALQANLNTEKEAYRAGIDKAKQLGAFNSVSTFGTDPSKFTKAQLDYTAIAKKRNLAGANAYRRALEHYIQSLNAPDQNMLVRK